MKREPNISRKRYFDRDGQSQKQRFPEALDPSFAKIDDHSLKDLLNFAKKYAEELCFFDTSTDTSHDTWAPFFDEIHAEQIVSTLGDSDEYEPHLALYIAFLRLFQHAQNHINTLTKEHLDFYYQHVLKLEKKAPVPDKAHVVFELKKNVEKQGIQAGALFKAGKDSKGAELFYALTQDIIVNNAKIESLRSVFVDFENVDFDNNDAVHIAPKANSSDGLGGKLDQNDPQWPPFGNNTLARAELGFALASPVLLLQEGKREINVYFTSSGADVYAIGNMKDIFNVYFSGEKGLIGPKKASLADCNGQDSLKFTVLLEENEGAIINYSPEIHGSNFETSFPLMRVLLDSKNCSYSSLKNIVINKVRIEVQVSEIQGLGLENDLGLLDAAKPFMPFGPSPIAGSNFSIGYEEAFTKNLKDSALNIEWQNVPKKDLSDYYDAYKKASFTLTEESLENLKNKGVPDNILEDLESLKNQKFIEKDKFLDAVEWYIGLEQTHKYETLILKYANNIVDSNQYFTANLFVKGKPWSCVHLFKQENAQSPIIITILETQRSLLAHPTPAFADTIHKLSQQRSRWAEDTLDHIQLTSSTRSIPSEASEAPPQESESDTRLKRGYIKLRLKKSFLHKEYRELYTKRIVEYTTQKEPSPEELTLREETPPPLILPNEPYIPMIQSLKLEYTAETDTIDLYSTDEDDFLRNEVEFFHITAFGQMRQHSFQREQLSFDPGRPYYKITEPALTELKNKGIPNDILGELRKLRDLAPQTEKGFLENLEKRFKEELTTQYKSLIWKYTRDRDIYLIPQYRNEGEFYIGIADLKSLQNLSVLFQVAEGSANPGKKHVPLIWSILSDNYWKVLDENHILSDTTNELLNSGIIRFFLPEEATNTNTILPGRNYWLKAEVDRDSDAVCQLIDVRANAALVEFEDHQNDPEHLRTSLKAGAISKFTEPIAAIKCVEQPYASFSGQMEEEDRSFYARVSERLRHKQRAITIWDYERMILQHFPSIYKAKCLSHRSSSSEFAPGHVTIIVVPDLKNKNAVNPFEPKVDLNTLAEIGTFLGKYTGEFVKLHIENPSYEQIRVDFRVSFYRGFEFGYHRDRLNQEIQRFLSPWTFGEEQEIVFGGQIHESIILNFIEKRPYVDYITDFEMYHILEIIGSFELSEKSLTEISKEGVPEVIITELEGLKNQEYSDKKKFIQDLKKTLKEKETQYQALILKHARIIIETRTEVVCASTPKTILVSSLDHKIEAIEK